LLQRSRSPSHPPLPPTHTLRVSQLQSATLKRKVLQDAWQAKHKAEKVSMVLKSSAEHGEELAVHGLQSSTAKRLRDVFADLIVEKTEQLCDDVVNEADEWIANLRRERLQQLIDDCASSIDSWFGCDTTCPETECVVQCGCMGADEMEARLQNGTLELGNIRMETMTLLQLENLADSLRYNVATTALEFVVMVGSDENFRGQVNALAARAEEQLCIAVGSLFETHVADASAQERLMATVQSLGTRVSEGLASIAAQGAAMITDIMKFIFSSAALVPYIGEGLAAMLTSIADYGGQYIQARFDAFLQRTTSHLMNLLADHAIAAANALATASEESLSVNVVEQLSFVFNCTAADELLDGLTEVIDGLFAEEGATP